MEDFNKKIRSMDKDEYLFRFLSPLEQDIIKKKLYKVYHILMDGGYEDAEYKRVKIATSPINKDELDIVILKIIYDKRYLNLSHRKILGNLMSLGIKRDSIGDIVGDCFVTTKEMLNFLKQEFIKIDDTPIELQIVLNIEKIEETINEKIIYPSSMRLDGIIAKACNLSRDKAQDLIDQEMVKINHKITKNSSQICNVYDIISIRKYGRVIINEFLGNSKSDRIILKIELKR